MKLTKDSICIANARNVFDFYGTREIAEAKLAEANRSSFGPYEVMTLGEQIDAERKAILGKPMLEISEEKYEEMLGVLPPQNWHTAADGVNLFLLAEYISGNFTSQYANYNGRYYVRNVDARDKSTYITREQIEQHNLLPVKERLGSIF
jgi:hypothetical protein